jgi:hypothetical protein
VGGACGMNGTEQSYIQGLVEKDKGNNLQNLGVDGSKILECNFKIPFRGLNRNM